MAEHIAPDEVTEHGLPRHLVGFWLKLVTALALAFSTFQLVIAAYAPLSSLVTRSFHVGFLLAITLLLYPRAVEHAKNPRKNTWVPWYDVLLAALALCLALYHWVYQADLIQRSGDPSRIDITVGTIFVVLVFEATRRVMGWALPAESLAECRILRLAPATQVLGVEELTSKRQKFPNRSPA